METCRPPDSSSTASGKEVYMEEEEEEEEVMYEEELCDDDEEDVASAVQDIGCLNEAEKPLVGAEVCPCLRDSDGKPTADSKNGLKSDGAAGAAAGGVGPKTTMFTWFVVLALLGVWSSVAVVYFDVVDYDSVIARAKEFRVNFSEVLQGKLMAYDRDGDGDFDMEDAKVLLGLTKDGDDSENADSLEEVLDILAQEGSDWFYGFFTFLHDVVTSPVNRGVMEEEEEDEEEGDEDRQAASQREGGAASDDVVEGVILDLLNQ